MEVWVTILISTVPSVIGMACIVGMVVYVIRRTTRKNRQILQVRYTTVRNPAFHLATYHMSQKVEQDGDDKSQKNGRGDKSES